MSKMSPAERAARLIAEHKAVSIPCANPGSVHDRLETRGFARAELVAHGTSTWLLYPTDTRTKPTAVARWEDGQLHVWGPIPSPAHPRGSRQELGRHVSLRVREAVLRATLDALGVQRNKGEGYGAALRRWYEQRKT